MAYEVTATRRRPKTFDELAGQEFVAATLKNSLETGHIAHAYLFSGPRGCGKTSAARILARSLRCEKGPTPTPCGHCPQCEEIAKGSSMDVIEIDGASNTGVNDVRQIKEEVLFSPTSGRFKVYIIDEVHMLSNNAFNALLKTIEEPPPNVIFIFATTELQKVPATIKSRCQQFNFRLIPIETIKSLLAQACKEIEIEAEDEALFWIARESTGSLRDAYTLFDQVVSFSDGNIRSDIIREKLGLVGLERLNEFAEACAVNDVAGALSKIDELIGDGVAVEQFVTDLAGYYHSLFLLKAGVTREALLGYPPERFSAKVLEKLDAPRLAHAGELLFTLHRDIRYSVSSRFELETLTSKLCWLDRWISPAELAEAVNKAGAILKGGNSPQGGLGRPLAPGAESPRAENPRAESPKASISQAPGTQREIKDEIKPGQSGFLTEGFKAYKAAKEREAATGSAVRPISVPQNPADPGTASQPQLSAGVQTVLKLFNGTIIKNGTE